MNAPAAVNAFRWLIWDTIRQSIASRIFWVMLIASGLCIVFCFSVSITGALRERTDEIGLYGADGKLLTDPDRNPGVMSLAFGAIRLPLYRTGASEIQFLEAILGRWVAGLGGLLLALIWTAGFLPEFLQPASATIFLAKPIPRWCLLTGKFLGVVSLVAAMASFFFFGTWLALGLRTGFWQPSYLAGIPLLVLNFAITYGFSVLLATWSRNTITCLFGSILFWLTCFGMNYGRHAAVAWSALMPDKPALPGSFRFLAECGYWLLPKPADLVMLLDDALGLSENFTQIKEFEFVQQHGQFFPELSILTSLLFTVAMIAIAARKLRTAEF